MNKHLFSIDLGNKAIKMKRANQDNIIFPSRYLDTTYVDGANRFNFGLSDLDTDLNVGKYKLVNSKSTYYFGKDIHKLGKDQHIFESLGFGNQRYKSKYFQDMLSFSICELARGLEPGMIEAELVIGLPTDDYVESNLREIFMYAKGQHSVEINGVAINVNITNVHAIPQPIGTFYNLLFDDNGTMINNELNTQKTGIVDIGGLTKLFDIVNNSRMETSERQQKDTGMWNLYGLISELLDVDSSLRPNKFQIESCVKKGIMAGGHAFIHKPNNNEKNIVNLTEAVNKGIELYTMETISEIKTIFTRFSTLDNLIFTGGGSRVLDKELINSSFNNINIIFSDDGEFSNVNGYYKYGIMNSKE